jgi:hypothetical protein
LEPKLFLKLKRTHCCDHGSDDAASICSFLPSMQDAVIDHLKSSFSELSPV